MSGSGNIINYNLRTAKSVERRMILVTVKELIKHVNFNDLRYIGFGSTFFTDFKLFHKELHIDDMISIEMVQDLERRLEFNKPYKCIKIELGKSTDVIPVLEWPASKKNLVWFDYDGKLNFDIFNDVERLFSNLSSGSIYLMTCNKQLSQYEGKLHEFTTEFEPIAPLDTTENNFKGDQDFLLIRRMLLTQIEETLNERNRGIAEGGKKLVFRQLFFFTYRDGAPMLSFGGFIDEVGNDFTLERYNLTNFSFIKTSDERYNISPPNLTYKEVHLLNSCLPNDGAEYFDEELINFIPHSDRTTYRELYRYLPHYMDVYH